MSEEKCAHRKPLEMGYGFGRASGWSGIGITWRCPDCSECLWFDDDGDCSAGEVSSNDKKRLENVRWKP